MSSPLTMPLEPQWTEIRDGVKRVWGGSHCTASETDRFYSYRRDGVTGRMGSLIWLKPA